MRDRVVTTQWNLIVAARDGSGADARFALETLCRTYWRPLYAFVRHQGRDPEAARDLTQAYFAELLEKNFLADLDPAKGRFRSFLFASMRNFLAHQRDRETALRRGGAATLLSLDLEDWEASYAPCAVEGASPEKIFEQRWARTVLDRAMARLQHEQEAAGKGPQFQLLRPYLTSLEPHLPYREAAATLGLTEGAVKVAVHRLRGRFGRCLRRELVDTLVDPLDLDDELRHLLTVLRP